MNRWDRITGRISRLAGRGENQRRNGHFAITPREYRRRRVEEQEIQKKRKKERDRGQGMYLLRLTLASASLVVTRWGAGLDAAIPRISHSDSSCTPCTVCCPPLPEPLPLAIRHCLCAIIRPQSFVFAIAATQTNVAHKQSSASSTLVLALSAYRSFDRAVTVDGLSQYRLGSSVDSTR